MTAATSQAAITRASWRLPTDPLVCYQRGQPDRCLLRWWVRHMWKAQDARRLDRSPFARADLSGSIPYERWAKGVWKMRYRRVAAMPVIRVPSGILNGLLCIHPKESSDWHLNGGMGPQVSGGLQIALQTWIANGGLRYAPAAYLASPLEQLMVGAHIVETSGWAAWPQTSRACGL